jgi:hypothetical protein
MRPTKNDREKSGGNAMASISRLGKLLILWRNRYQKEIAIEGS